MPLVNLPDRALKAAGIDCTNQHAQPSVVALVMATILSVAGSLSANAFLAYAGSREFPSTKDYVHFRFSDYATLTIIGVLIACASWPIVARISSAARRLFFRLAVTVTLVLWLPDVYLLIRHQPVHAVVVLMVMHLATAIATYNILVRVAPVKESSVLVPGSSQGPPVNTGVARAPGEEAGTEPGNVSERPNYRLATALVVLVVLEFVVGVAALVLLPTSRPSGWLPTMGLTIYLVHSILGLPIALGAVALLVRVRGSTRTYRLSGWIGCIGVAIAGVGGLLTVAHPLRLVGIACMLVGSVIAAFGYLIPVLDRMSDDPPPVGEG
jgi:hypothetical protein